MSSEDMSIQTSVVPDTTVPQPAGQRPAIGAPKAAPEISELADVPLSELLQRLHSTDSGLRASDAAIILKKVGSNQIESTKPKSLLSVFAERFSNPLVLILLFAAGVSAFTGDIPSFVIIMVIVLISVILDVTQEYQAQNAAEIRSIWPRKKHSTAGTQRCLQIQVLSAGLAVKDSTTWLEAGASFPNYDRC